MAHTQSSSLLTILTENVVFRFLPFCENEVTMFCSLQKEQLAYALTDVASTSYCYFYIVEVIHIFYDLFYFSTFIESLFNTLQNHISPLLMILFYFLLICF